MSATTLRSASMPPMNAPDRTGAADRIQGASLMLLAAAITALIWSGRYLSYVTPRSIPYLVVAVAALAVFAVAAWCGVFHCTMATLYRTLLVVIAPMLLMVLPLDAGSGTMGGTNRAIAVSTTATSEPAGLNRAAKTITIADDDFGAWFDRIDHDPGRYAGYTVIVTGFVSIDSSMAPHQFGADRMLMTCCVLDMTGFGFAVQTNEAALPRENSWVTVRGTVARGRIGTADHGYDGIVLTATSITPSDTAPSGYFYRS